MRNKLLEKDLKEFYNRRHGVDETLNATGRGVSGGISAMSAIYDAQRMIDFVTHAESYSSFPEHCFNEPEMVRLAAEKLHSGIESAQKLLRILEKHYGVVEKKQDGNICGGQVSEDDINGYVVRVKDCCCERSCCDEKRYANEAVKTARVILFRERQP